MRIPVNESGYFDASPVIIAGCPQTSVSADLRYRIAEVAAGLLASRPGHHLPVFEKPFPVAELLNAVSESLNGAGQRRGSVVRKGSA